jgi:membrane-associated protease RseP (regulator of RpoE activity)
LPELFRPSVGLAAVDVVDVNGAVVVRVDPKGAAEGAGIGAGDRIVSVDSAPVADAGAFAKMLAGRRAGERLTLEWVDRTGANKNGAVIVSMEPRLIAMNDQSLPFNTLAVTFAAEAATMQGQPMAAMVARLNYGVAMMRLGHFTRALAEIERVTLPAGPGVSNGTVQYLLGLCYEALGRQADAQRALQAASASPEALLTEDGPSVGELATRKLVEISRRGRGAFQ